MAYQYIKNNICKFKIGDKLICHTSHSAYSWKEDFTVGKIYIISEVGRTSSQTDGFWMNGNDSTISGFSYPEDYNKHFKSLSEIRKLKLKKINESR